MEEEIKQEQKPENIVDKAERLNKELDEKIKKFEAEREAFMKEKAENLLAGTAGGNIPVEKRELTPKEYADYVLKHGKAPE